MYISTLRKEVNQKKCLNKKLCPCVSNRIEKVSYCCEGMEILLDKNAMAIHYDEESEDWAVCIRQSTMVDNGDYVYDGEDEVWQEEYECVDTFYGVSKCPCCGEDIVINNKTKDITDDVNEYLKLLPGTRRTKIDKHRRIEIYNEMAKLFDFERTPVMWFWQ